MANIYADQMVLQMAPKSTQIWGFGTAGTSVSVSVNGQQVGATVDAGGTWRVRLAPENAGGPYTLTATHSTDSVSINVWFGDVWMMDPTGETNKAVQYQNIRIMQVANAFTSSEQEEVKNVPNFSALCIMFGERMSDSLGNSRPIGLIDSTWGGTYIEAWSSNDVFTACNTPGNPGTNQNANHALWNAMMHPLTNMAARGAIWYQGESNVGYNADYYGCHMQNLVNDWRNKFVDGNVPVPGEGNHAFPFGIVQIGPFSGGGTSGWGYLRWHQSVDVGTLPNSFIPEGFMAAAYDTTDPSSPTGDIHPRDKPTVADRLSRAAKNLLYGENWSTNGPTPVSTSFSTNAVTIVYDRNIRQPTGTTGFSVRYNGGAWQETSITSSTANSVTVAYDSSMTNTELAYAWQGVVCDYMQCSIYSDDAEALPAQVWYWNLANIKMHQSARSH
ncbi:hypothetical protein B566_EDAN003627 [Ephemera danica]|nr:hypothetical protein B566_EDAN003627 [Ephemera danica]